MADYNIIYTSADDKTYLWNGSNFDLLHNEDNAGLMYSGKTYEDKELPAAIKKAKQVVKKTFPVDRSPQVEKVEVPENSKDEIKGHSRHITS